MTLFTDKIAIVTGGASGIGRALGEELAKRGAVVILADINLEGVENVAAAIENAGGQAIAARLDVTDADAVQKLVDGTCAEYGQLDYIFNNAGILVGGEARDMALDDWRRVLDINLMGVINGVAASYPLMVKQKSGHIVNTSSIAGFTPLPIAISYTASKHALMGISTTLRAEGADLGVKVSVVCPGLIDTQIYNTSKYVKINTKQLLSKLRKNYSSQKCALEILHGVERNKAIIIITPLAKVLWVMYRLFPLFYINHLTRLLVRRHRKSTRIE